MSRRIRANRQVTFLRLEFSSMSKTGVASITRLATVGLLDSGSNDLAVVSAICPHAIGERYVSIESTKFRRVSLADKSNSGCATTTHSILYSARHPYVARQRRHRASCNGGNRVRGTCALIPRSRMSLETRRAVCGTNRHAARAVMV